jgi:MFS family permease
MSIIPKIEKITFDASLSHFLLMFGYKLFSLYFPLFLVAQGLSLPQVGYTYLLIYLPIAIFSPVVGFFSHKINPLILAGLGIFGYGFYSLAMILIHPVQFPILFSFFQIFLGISAAMFFVSMRGILMASKLENHNRAFAWFYSSPAYADVIAPVIGALLIWKFGFVGVFAISVMIQFFNGIFCFSQIRKQKFVKTNKNFQFKEYNQNYKNVFKTLKQKVILAPIIIGFSVLILAGFYRAFFVLFLKDLGWSQNLILFFVSSLSLLFLPLSLYVIKRVGDKQSEKSIFQGALLTSGFSIALGLFGGFANFFIIFFIKLGQGLSGLMCGSGRSGLLSQKLKKYPEEASAIDTIFSPLGVALGSLISGLIIGFLGFNNLFILGGLFVIAVLTIGKLLTK